MLWQAAARRSLLTHAFSHTIPPARSYLTCFRVASSPLLRTTTTTPPLLPSHIRLFSLSSLFRPREAPKPVASASLISHITNLELAADKNPSDVFAQIELFRELVNTQSDAGRKIVMSRWERMCEFVSKLSLYLVNILLNTLRIYLHRYFAPTKLFHTILWLLCNPKCPLVSNMLYNEGSS